MLPKLVFLEMNSRASFDREIVSEKKKKNTKLTISIDKESIDFRTKVSIRDAFALTVPPDVPRSSAAVWVVLRDGGFGSFF